METARQFNFLLAEMSVFRQNVYSHHWNMMGFNFFSWHGTLGDFYGCLGADIDTVAERILALGGTPEHRFSRYLLTSGIAESEVLTSEIPIAEDMISSLTKTIGRMYLVRDAAVTENDEGTVDMIGGMIAAVQKNLWFWSAILNRTSSTGIPGMVKREVQI